MDPPEHLLPKGRKSPDPKAQRINATTISHKQTQQAPSASPMADPVAPQYPNSMENTEPFPSFREPTEHTRSRGMATPTVENPPPRPGTPLSPLSEELFGDILNSEPPAHPLRSSPTQLPPKRKLYSTSESTAKKAKLQAGPSNAEPVPDTIPTNLSLKTQFQIKQLCDLFPKNSKLDCYKALLETNETSIMVWKSVEYLAERQPVISADDEDRSQTFVPQFKRVPSPQPGSIMGRYNAFKSLRAQPGANDMVKGPMQRLNDALGDSEKDNSTFKMVHYKPQDTSLLPPPKKHGAKKGGKAVQGPSDDFSDSEKEKSAFKMVHHKPHGAKKGGKAVKEPNDDFGDTEQKNSTFKMVHYKPQTTAPSPPPKRYRTRDGGKAAQGQNEDLDDSEEGKSVLKKVNTKSRVIIPSPPPKGYNTRKGGKAADVVPGE